MLDSIYRIGKAQKSESVFADNPRVEYVIGILFVKKGNTVKYDKIEISEFQNKSLYLYKRDPSGKPGLFLSGVIQTNDIKSLIKPPIDKSEKEIAQDFTEKKIMWFQKGKLLKHKSNLSLERRDELDHILSELALNKNRISHEIILKLKELKPQKYLITIKPPSNGTSTFVGNIREYKLFFEKGALNKNTSNVQKMLCSVCNEQKIIEAFTERPLPFYFADKATYFPHINESQKNKGFPLCDQCYIELQKGWKYIDNSFNYNITLSDTKSAGIKFWLIPHLQKIDQLKKLEKDQQNKSLYLKELRDLLSNIKRITEYDTGSDDIHSFLRFSSLFYGIDDRGNMRVTNYVSGILPKYLYRLFDTKMSIEKKFPYVDLSKRNKKFDLIFGFPILVDFFEDATPQWRDQVVGLLENMFTGKKIDRMLVLQVINNRIFKLWKSQKPQDVFYECLKGLMLMEYLIRLEDDINVVPMSTTQMTPQTEIIEKFLAGHPEVLSDDNSHAAFGVGVCVGILLEVQAMRYNKVAPFWNRLNKLDLDLDRIKELFPQVKSYLAIYDEQSYDTIINFLGIKLVSKINSSIQTPKKQLNFSFSIGMALGYLIKRNLI